MRTSSARGVIAQKESTFLVPGIVFAPYGWRKNSLRELIWRIRSPIMLAAKEFATTFAVNYDLEEAMARPASTRPTEVELQILRILWGLGPSPVREIHKRLKADKGTNY